MDKKEIIASVVLFIGTVLFCILMFLLVKYVDINSGQPVSIIIVFLCYSLFVLWIGNKVGNSNNKYLKSIIYTLSAPVAISILLLKLIGPFMIITMGIIIYILSAIIIPLILNIIINGENSIFTALGIFIFCTLSTFIAILFNKTILKNIIKWHPAIKSTNSKKENDQIIELINYIFNINNIRFFIYLAYFIFIIMFSIKTINDKSVLDNERSDYAIMQAFLVFLAFDNLRINSKNVKWVASDLLNKFTKIILIDKAIDETNKDNH